MSLRKYQRGDIVRILIDLPPGLEDLVKEEDSEYHVSGKLATVVAATSGHVSVRVEGLPRETRWSFETDEVELVIPAPEFRS